MTEEFEDGGGVDGVGGVGDAALVGLVSSAFDEGRGGHEARDVLARGRQLRRRRRAMPAFGAVGVVAVAAGLAVAMSGPNSTAVNVDNAAFSVHTNTTTGKVTITIRQLFDENELKGILAKAGIRSVFAPLTVHVGKGQQSSSPCTWPGTTPLPAEDLLQGTMNTTTIDPAKMPAGSVLAFQYYTFGKGSITTATLLSGEPDGCGA